MDTMLDPVVNVPAVDALHVIRRQLDVIRLAVSGLVTVADELGPDCEAIAMALDDVAVSVTKLIDAPRLPALTVVK